MLQKLMTLGCAVCVSSAFALMEPATPESQGVPSQAVLDWIDIRLGKGST